MDGVTQWVEFAVVLICAAAAVQDLFYREIGNSLSLAIVALFVVMPFSGVWAWASLPAVVGPAVAVFVVCAVLFVVGVLGGGDVKLLGATSLWITPGHVSAFLLSVALIGGLLSLLYLALRWMSPQRQQKQGAVDRFCPGDHERSKTIPYGVAIAAGALSMWCLGAMGPPMLARVG
ncbi:hypothetical protein F1188_00205 [Roseospira marina]|uniref:Prepilin type IV endopeptidase peptidase domain-containing protein n=1 Tax=Roseospira marina TaxID=140057 RepID=A0A5M6IG08_9PROT|nr:prepilin peptidase [Roseospira marina]KAA5607230.1 hypothetical protein F1188_00205 [Roseospira marina]MBB4312619.1 prepilin peptidase CpaA [Roseospira marina]MBB5085365.1 prepilin peptidase CpaA [Roseospira marina]